MTAVPVIEPMPDRISTFRVLTGDPLEPGLVGFIRLHDGSKGLVWVARTLGSEKRAADIRRFRERDLAAGWLLEKAVTDPTPKRRKVAA